MAKLIILRGNSGSGKTTVAKELQKKFGRNTMLISQDVIRRDMLKVSDGLDTKAVPLMIELLRYGYTHSEITILEGIMHAEWYQPLFETAGELYEENVFAYYFDIPFSETLKRHLTKPNCKDFGEAEMKRWWCEKDYSPILREKPITNHQKFEEIVEDIYNSVTASSCKK